jgi:hypothetical protein
MCTLMPRTSVLLACAVAPVTTYSLAVPLVMDPQFKSMLVFRSLQKILKLVAASAAEAELGALFLNAQEAKVIQFVLEELGHPQAPTPIHINNTTAVSIVNKTIKQQRSRAIEMRYLGSLMVKLINSFDSIIYPDKNLGDYPSKHHTADIHEHVCPYYVYMHNSQIFLPQAAKPSS